MHVVFRFFCSTFLCLSILAPLIGVEKDISVGQARLDAAALSSLAAYYRSRFPDTAALSAYLDQASVDPVGFRETVKADLLTTFKVASDALNAAVLTHYVQAETVSMHFLKTGHCDMPLQDLKSLCSDKRLLSEFRIVPCVILSFRDSNSFPVLSDVFLWKPQIIPLFQQVKHPRFEDAAALYLSYVYRDFVMRKQAAVQHRYVKSLDEWLLALHFQGVHQRIIFESIDLAVKISAQAELTDSKHLRLGLMQCIRDCGQRDWQEAYVRSCLQHGVTDQLDGISASE